jgi:thermitase
VAGTNRLRAAALVLAMVLALVVIVGALFTAATPQAHAQTSQPERFAPGEVLVKFKAGTTGEERAAAHRKNDAEVEEIIPDLGVRVVEVPVGKEQSSVAAYERNPNVSFAEVNTIFRIAEAVVPDDPEFNNQWQYNNTGQSGGELDADIDALEAWQVTDGSVPVGSDTVDIAILDTGIDQEHVDLQAKLSVDNQKDFTGSKTLDDMNSHGTHVAGSAAAVTNNGTGVAGTCPACSLYNAKVLEEDGSGKLSWVASGIMWAANHDAEVISMSFGGPSGSDALKKAVNYAWNHDSVLVAAAGNEGSRKPFYPAYYAKVIAVASTDRNDTRASSSNYGKSWVDVAAPGVSILSTLPGNAENPGGRYGVKSGTSMATPHVAGEAGLLWSTASYGTSNQSVRDRLEGTAEDIEGTGTCQGRINANFALDSATPTVKNTC